MGLGGRALACWLLTLGSGCYGSSPASPLEGGPAADTGRLTDECRTGEVHSCECADGFGMDVACRSGTWPPCPCPTSECALGGSRSCSCASGMRGAQSCLATALYGPCECGEPLPEPNPEPPPGDPGTIAIEPDDEASFLWDDGVLHDLDLELLPEDLATIDQSPAAEIYVPGYMHFAGEPTIGPVGIRYKGSYGAFLEPCTADQLGQLGGPRVGKCSIKVSFNWSDPQGRFHGLKKLQLHSLGHDPSLMRERLGYAMFREMGVPAPRATHVRLSINGVFAGVYGLIENIDGRFTHARFSEGGDGNLYKEVWPVHDNPDTYLAALKTNEDAMPSVQQMRDFKSAVDLGPAAAARWLDMEMTQRYLAVDRVLANDDGIMHFWCSSGGQGGNPGPYGNHNYYWYFAGDSSRAWLIPWDLDSSMEPDGFVQVYSDWLQPQNACGCQSYPQQTFPVAQAPPNCDPLIGGWATMREGYDAQVEALVAGPFSPDAVEAKLVAWEALIRASVVEQEAGGIIAVDQDVLSVSAWEDALRSLRADLDFLRTNRGYPY